MLREETTHFRHTPLGALSPHNFGGIPVIAVDNRGPILLVNCLLDSTRAGVGWGMMQ